MHIKADKLRRQSGGSLFFDRRSLLELSSYGSRNSNLERARWMIFCESHARQIKCLIRYTQELDNGFATWSCLSARRRGQS